MGLICYWWIAVVTTVGVVGQENYLHAIFDGLQGPATTDLTGIKIMRRVASDFLL